MTYNVVVPTFAGALSRNALELCDLIRIDDESAVPVSRFRIESSHGTCDFPVGPGKYKTALLLFYWAVLYGRPEYFISTPMLGDLQRYYGDALIADAHRPTTDHKALHFLVGHSPAVKLYFRPNLRDHLVSERTVEDVIRHGWARYNALRPGAPEPLLRQAIVSFSEGVEHGQIKVMNSGPAEDWPSDVWASRVLTLMQRLGNES
ncbi:MAG: hypothetical protein E6R05_03750 [Candidatus Moraniibacteriota bacterium]|nr:MAG: hypothetical protein E6R05_03750 [Candidatus Moranbacteria bacterium]